MSLARHARLLAATVPQPFDRAIAMSKAWDEMADNIRKNDGSYERARDRLWSLIREQQA